MELSHAVREAHGLPSERRSRLLRELFSEICDKVDWKGPIDTVVDADMLDLYKEAIAFMTATDTRIVGGINQGKFRIVSVGYHAGPAGDH